MKAVIPGRLSVIIVNYHSADLVAESLRTLLHYNKGDIELIVCDNSSSEHDRAKILAAFPLVHWIDMQYNAGFARANNAGMRRATGDVFLLLNPDTVSFDNSIERCYTRLKESGFAAAGVQLLDAAHRPQISGSYFVKGGLNHLLPIPYWGSVVRWAGYRSKARIPGIQQAQAVQETDWISGAFLMAKRSPVAAAGMMDEDFFLYGEEVEWCSRLQKNGKLALFGDLSIIHLEGATINKSQMVQEQGYYNLYDRKGLQLMVSNHLRVRKQYGRGWFLFLLLNYTWGVPFFFLCSSLHCLFTGRSPAGAWTRVGKFARNVAHLWRLTPTIMRNQPHFYKMF